MRGHELGPVGARLSDPLSISAKPRMPNEEGKGARASWGVGGSGGGGEDAEVEDSRL
jgi:hypothetical protein